MRCFDYSHMSVCERFQAQALTFMRNITALKQERVVTSRTCSTPQFPERINTLPLETRAQALHMSEVNLFSFITWALHWTQQQLLITDELGHNLSHSVSTASGFLDC